MYVAVDSEFSKYAYHSSASLIVLWKKNTQDFILCMLD